MIAANNLIFGRKYTNPLAVGLIHAYKLEELSGTTFYDSIGTLHATTSSEPLTNQTGKVGKGIRITNQFGGLQFGGNIGLSSFPFSYKFWFNFENITTDRSFIDNPSANNYCGVSLRSSGQTLTVRFGNNGGRFAGHRKDYTTGNVITSTGWHQIHLNVTGFGIFELFVDGVLYTGGYTESGSATSVNLTDAVYLYYYHSSGLAIGTSDEIYFYNITKTSSEVLELYTLENAGTSILT